MDLAFDNRFVSELPADPETRNFTRRVQDACYSFVSPTAVTKPSVVAVSQDMAKQLGLSPADCLSDAFAQVMGGNALWDGMQTYATRYGGHQFGGWAGQLGDGRAISLGEVVNKHGARWELQLKGAGPTPYSRHADGRAVLRSSVREFLCSEAMHHLGVPTTRALSLTLTGETVLRDMFYNGQQKYEPGAIVCRTAPSFIRFGNFEILAAQGEKDLLQQLAFFTIRRDFPHLGEPTLDTIPLWLNEVAERTAKTIVHWMRVGFVHGVMNTDNMSILGLTIDYGPYGWLEGFEPSWTPNTTDAQGRRYSFGAQPNVGQWNLQMLVQALFGFIKDTDAAHAILQTYADTFNTQFAQTTRNKLGLETARDDDVDTLETPLMYALQQVETDMTLFYRGLAQISTDESIDDTALLAPIEPAYYSPETVSAEDRQVMVKWLRTYVDRLREEGVPDATRRERMNRVNPKYVLRNYLAQEAIDAAEAGDPTRIHALLDVLRNPYDEQPEQVSFAAKRPEWARNRPGCSTLSCSS